jgi:hypothetical protein
LGLQGQHPADDLERPREPRSADVLGGYPQLPQTLATRGEYGPRHTPSIGPEGCLGIAAEHEGPAKPPNPLIVQRCCSERAPPERRASSPSGHCDVPAPPTSPNPVLPLLRKGRPDCFQVHAGFAIEDEQRLPIDVQLVLWER